MAKRARQFSITASEGDQYGDLAYRKNVKPPKGDGFAVVFKQSNMTQADALELLRQVEAKVRDLDWPPEL